MKLYGFANIVEQHLVPYEYASVSLVVIEAFMWVSLNAKQKHLGCKKGEANQKQQLSDYRCVRT